jgi:hypothetical protein
MSRKIAVFVIALLALGALEFGLLGASAAGLVGGRGRQTLPPVAERGKARPTPTPGTAASRGASIELDQPSPAAIRCDGNEPSSLRVSVRDSDGHTVKDGTPVRFSVFNGSASPPSVTTGKGRASTSVVVYSDLYSLQPNVVVDVGDLEAAIRVRCRPDSGCPLSPPPNASPPCGEPKPCNPSPGSGPMSPPCAPLSPPPCNPNAPSTPPCATPTPYPCNPSPGTGPMSPPCAPLSPPPCDPNVPPFSPPCASPPTPTGIGGRIFIGTPSFVKGKIVVPVYTTTSTSPYSAFNVHLLFDGSLLSFATATDFASGGVLETSGANTFCIAQSWDSGSGLIGTCSILGAASTTSTGPLARITLTPKAASGCARLHLFTYGSPDGGDATTGTFTINSADATVQHNTYGADVTVNVADGRTGCAASPAG